MPKWGIVRVEVRLGPKRLLVPSNASLLAVTEIDGKVEAHYLLDSDMPSRERMVYCFREGMPVPTMEDGSHHVGTVVMDDGQVWYVFEHTGLVN